MATHEVKKTSELLKLYEEHVMSMNKHEEWAEVLTKLTEKYTDYVLLDAHHQNSLEDADLVMCTRKLRDYFTEAAKIVG